MCKLGDPLLDTNRALTVYADYKSLLVLFLIRQILHSYFGLLCAALAALALGL